MRSPPYFDAAKMNKKKFRKKRFFALILKIFVYRKMRVCGIFSTKF